MPPALVKISAPEVEIPNIRSNGEAKATNNVSPITPRLPLGKVNALP
jgi:hypothetical protein